MKPQSFHRGGSLAALRMTAAIALLLACAGEKPLPKAAASDVILITIDTWRADAAGFAGNTAVQTPFLDSLAQRGVVFRNAHAHNVVTLPSHVNILTGLYPYQHGVRDNAGFVLQQPTVAKTLHDAGFVTAAFVAAYPLDSRFGLGRDFDLYDDNYGKGAATVDFVIQERPATAVLEGAAKWWRSSEGRKRFLWVHLYDPHAPYKPSYLGEVAAVDRALATHLAPLLSSDPLVIVTGDHGEALGDHGELTHGLFAYEATLKVPLIVSGRGVTHRVDDRYVRHIDIVPTILAACGLPARTGLPGRSLLQDIGDRDTYFESLSASLNRGWAPLTGVIHGGQKYIELPIAELYDIQDDPAEKNNLRDERRRDTDAARRMLASMTANQAKSARSVAPEEAARLRSLGYITGSPGAPSNFTPADDPKNLIAIDSKMHQVVEAYEQHELRRALALAQEVVAARPEMAAGRELLAFVLQQNERVGDAIAQLRRLVASGRATEDIKVQLALLLSESGRAEEAIKLLEPFVSTGSPNTLNAYGVALADRGDFRQAIDAFQRVLQSDPNSAPALQNLGIVALRMDDVARAREYLERAIALNPRLPLALNTLGVVAARQEDFSRAVDLWRQAVAIDPRQYDALYNIALVEARSGNQAEARKALRQFIATAPPQRYAREIAEARRALGERPSRPQPSGVPPGGR